MRNSNLNGRLYLDGVFVGTVQISGWDGPWGFGQFAPVPAFQRFAPLFEEWSRLMHCPEVTERLTERVGDELRKIECALYAIDAKIYVQEYEQWRQTAILTIDGNLIEWKERFCDHVPAPAPAPALRPARRQGVAT